MKKSRKIAECLPRACAFLGVETVIILDFERTRPLFLGALRGLAPLEGVAKNRGTRLEDRGKPSPYKSFSYCSSSGEHYEGFVAELAVAGA
ncbi:MAG: hypothetical protein MJK04_14525, partial [Psychrosphaera sp.]|nr:hypothetical protein [Psychrosphaera sp.]